MYPFEPHYGNQNYYQPFEVSFMNQQQQQQPYMNQSQQEQQSYMNQQQTYMNSQYYMPPSPSPMEINKRCFIRQNNRIRR